MRVFLERKIKVCAQEMVSQRTRFIKFPWFLKRRLSNRGSGLQNLHRGFDSRRRLSFEEITRSQTDKAEVLQTSVLTPVLLANELRGQDMGPPAKDKGLKERGLRRAFIATHVGLVFSAY